MKSLALTCFRHRQSFYAIKAFQPAFTPNPYPKILSIDIQARIECLGLEVKQVFSSRVCMRYTIMCGKRPDSLLLWLSQEVASGETRVGWDIGQCLTYIPMPLSIGD
jgi:hypothetical protein